MNFKLKIKAGTFLVNSDDPAGILKSSHPVFKAVEKFGREVVRNLCPETQSMYYGSFEEFGGGSYLSIKGAVEDAIYALCEYAYENKAKEIKSSQFYKIGLDACFEA